MPKLVSFRTRITTWSLNRSGAPRVSRAWAHLQLVPLCRTAGCDSAEAPALTHPPFAQVRGDAVRGARQYRDRRTLGRQNHGRNRFPTPTSKYEMMFIVP